MMRRLVVAGHEPNERNGRALAGLDAILVSPSDEQRELSAARLNGQKSRSAAVRPPKANAPGPQNSQARASPPFTKQLRERVMGLELTTSSLGKRRKTKD